MNNNLFFALNGRALVRWLLVALGVFTLLSPIVGNHHPLLKLLGIVSIPAFALSMFTTLVYVDRRVTWKSMAKIGIVIFVPLAFLFFLLGSLLFADRFQIVLVAFGVAGIIAVYCVAIVKAVNYVSVVREVKADCQAHCDD